MPPFPLSAQAEVIQGQEMFLDQLSKIKRIFGFLPKIFETMVDQMSF